MNTIKKIILLTVTACTLHYAGVAQKKALGKIPGFSSALRAGLLNGQADKAGAEIQIISGINYKTWFTGLGGGIDYYDNLKSIPLFIDVRKDFKEKKNTPFINADLGYNIPLKNKNYKNNQWLHYKFEGGLYYELGAGYKFTLTNSLGLSISAGYSYKNVTEEDKAYYGIGPFDQPLPPTINTYDYKFRRISIKAGFWF